jgi:hypothetical protein
MTPKATNLKNILLLSFCSLFFFGFGQNKNLNNFEPSIEGVKGVDRPVGAYAPVTSKQLSFGFSQGESTGILLKITTDRCVRLNVDNFKSAEGNQILPDYQLFLVDKVSTKKSSFQGAATGELLDPLLPVANDAEFCPSTSPVESIWVYLYFNEINDYQPGTYLSQVSLGIGSPLKLSVNLWKMRMNQREHVYFYAGLPSWFNLLGHYGKWKAGEGDLTRDYVEKLDKLAIDTFESWVHPPPIIESTEGFPILDLENYPNKEDSFLSIYGNFMNSRMINLPNPFSSDAHYAPEEYLAAIENTIHRYNLEERAYVYLWDEPREEDYEAIIERAKLVRQYAPSLKTLVTIHYVPKLESYVDIFVPVINFMDQVGFPDPAVYRKLQEQGKQVWIYFSCMSHGCEGAQDAGTPDVMLERQATSIRSLGPLAYRYHADALLYWRLNHAFQGYPARDPWKDQWYFTGNGDGTLLYPGRPGQHGLLKHQPILSLRIMGIEEVLHDIWYFREMDRLEQKPDWWEAAILELGKSPTEWSKDYAKYNALVFKIGNYLNSI